jgi:hypothetical protein
VPNVLKQLAILPIAILSTGLLSWEANSPSLREPIRRLKPSEFITLPIAVRNDLERRRCTIPQLGDSPNHTNVVKGHFANQTGVDWAVICSNGKSSAVLIFIGGQVAEVDSLERSDDEDWVADGSFSRVL